MGDRIEHERFPVMEHKIAESELALFIVQVALIFVVVCVSLLNLTNQWGNQNLWTVLLTSSLGYIMPNPRFKMPVRDKTINGIDDVNIQE